MKEQDERIERLLERYFDARTTEAEERELRDYFRYVDEIPASLRYARTMFGGLDALAEERYPGEGSVQTGPAVRPAEGMRRYETRSAAGRGARGGRKLRPLWGVAAAAAVVLGVERLHGAAVRCTDLRGGAALCAAALAAEGETSISDITHIDRGYQSIEDDLAALGADIRRVEETASP